MREAMRDFHAVALASAALGGITCAGVLAWFGQFGGISLKSPSTSSTTPAVVEAESVNFYDREVFAGEDALLETTSGDGRNVLEERLGGISHLVLSLMEEGRAASLPEAIKQRFPKGLPSDPQDVERFFVDRQIERFIEAGLSDAEFVIRRENELRLEMEQARFERERQGTPLSEIDRLTIWRDLREEIGDEQFERYLLGRQQPITVTLRYVLRNSPAHGVLIPGDKIVSYGGKRVFHIDELVDLAAENPLGESISIDLVRDGRQMRVYVPSGPLGVGTSRSQVR